MENPAGTEPEDFDFEIQISDDVLEDSESCRSNTNVSENGVTDAKVDLRASLSDVVLNQSLKFSERDIDFGEGGDQSNSEGFVETFDSIVVDKKAGPNGQPKNEFTDIRAVPGITTPDPVVAQSPDPSPPLDPTSHADLNGRPSDDIDDFDFEDADDPPLLTSTLKADAKEDSDDDFDFEDADDPPLLTSTLKADAKEDSDDDFDFDLPTSKVDNGKSVGFSGTDDSAEQKKAAPASEGDEKEQDKPKPPETSSGENKVSAAVAALPDVCSTNSVQPATAGVKIEITSPQPADTKSDEDSEEKEDRSHIITSSAADWDNVETVEAGFGDAQAGDGGELMSVPPLMSFSDLWQHFRSMDHTAVKDKIQVTVEKNGFAAIVSRLFGPPKLNKDLQSERELVFCVAATALDNRDDQHIQSLQTVYRALTGSRFNCQHYGSHWEEIGFQGRDPATDLRGTGMLALTQLVHFLQDDTTAQLARDIYKLSLHPTQNFPFCVMCINISRISLQALREGVLNRECNKQKRVMPVVNQLYAGALLHLYRVWKQGKTISDSGFVIRDVETRAKKQSKDLFKDLQTYITSQKSSGDAGAMGNMTLDLGGMAGGKEGNINFFSVVKSDIKTAAELY